MNATELFHADGTSAKVYYCAKCRIVSRSEADADKCCEPVICRSCPAPVEGYRLDCMECQRRRVDARDGDRYARAERVAVADYDQPMVYLEQLDRFVDVYDIDDDLDAWDGDEPLRVYGVTPIRMSLDADSMIESACSEMHAEAEGEIPAEGRAELQAMVDAWLAKHSPTSYEQDMGVVVVTEEQGQ